MTAYLIKNAQIINEAEIYRGSLVIEGQKISKIYKDEEAPEEELLEQIANLEVIDAANNYLMPGVIDDQVHFRDPGLTHKADIKTESKAAVAGGVTSFMEMPNTNPQTTTIEALETKYSYAADKSLANYSFYMGATNDNIEELLKVNPQTTCGIKVFMGASTGNMLVDNKDSLDKIFSQTNCLIATHCEDEETVRNKTQEYTERYGKDIPIEAHPEIRNADACYKSSSYAVGLAKKYNSRLHVLHLTTAKELELFDNSIPLTDKRITAEVCVHHLWFSDEDYARLGSQIKCNPAIKTKNDRDALRAALLEDKLDVIATDHAPHLLEEKNNYYAKAPAGLPLVQHSLMLMLEFHKQGMISLERVIEKMCHAPAECFHVKDRGYIREGYYADLVLFELKDEQQRPEIVSKDNVLYKCAWSPFEGNCFHSKVKQTFINGNLVYDNGIFNESQKGQRLEFSRN